MVGIFQELLAQKIGDNGCIMQKWKDKVVIVTGGSGGMGRAAAMRFAQAGARTFALGRTQEALDAVAGELENITPVVCDVADQKSVDQAMSIILKTGAPDVLIHTAGINTPDRFVVHSDESRVASEESWKRVLEINVLGVVNMMRAVTKPMAGNGGGKIVVVSSTAGHGFDSYAGVPYTASKWAVHGLLFTARAQLSAYNIVVSEYAPGEANTPIVDKRPVLPMPEHRQAMIQTEDCADALFFIASQDHSVSLVQLPKYQPFGGMPPEIPAPWLAGLDISPC
ncbi:MAG: NAD(P)-dependent dehydrogenase (short-subunit alcohol dehydrogenase family) [Verrucomicrobiales bacterium]|jgi:NAD(P)-dependent dehydrogenase (short-subunit alcohol dehydrogenase family)